MNFFEIFTFDQICSYFIKKFIFLDKCIQIYNRFNTYLESLENPFYHSNIGSQLIELYDNNDREEILYLGPEILNSPLSSSDRDMVIEMLINSSVVYGRHNYIMKIIPNKNGEDKKSKIYMAKYHQAKGEYETAFRYMAGVLIEHPTDIIIRKQTLSTLKDKISPNKYIDLINRHLSEFPLDTESWQELGEFYISFGKYNEAIYCFSELLLHEPNNLFYIITIADLYYTIARFPLSFKYYSKAISLNCLCTRALWGLILIYTRVIRNSKEEVENAAGDTQHLFSDIYSKLSKKSLMILKNIYIKSKSHGVVRAINRLSNEWDRLPNG